MSVKIKATVGDKMTLEQFSRVIQQRMYHLHETARNSIAACAVTALKGIRTITKVAKPSKIKVDITHESNLYPSFTSRGHRKKLCLRDKGSKIQYEGNEKIITSSKFGKIKDMQVFRFVNQYDPKRTIYLIIAPSTAVARKTAKNIVAKRLLAYSGLAKRAISFLMMKTHNKTKVHDNVSANVNLVGDSVTSKQEILVANKDQTEGKYGLILVDSLRYATKAIKGGVQSVDTQLKKAMNKIVSVINLKLKKSPLHEKMEIPFPEYSKRK